MDMMLCHEQLRKTDTQYRGDGETLLESIFDVKNGAYEYVPKGYKLKLTI